MFTADEIAFVCHETNRAYCKLLGDSSQKPWDEAPKWQRDSAVAGVLYHMRNPEARPSDSHNSWLAQKTLDGWKYGDKKDEAKKEHPCFVPYEELATSQRVKDYLFKAVVNAMLMRK